MNNNTIVFNLEGVLIKDNKINLDAVDFIKAWVKIGWKVYIQSEQGRDTALEFIKKKKLKGVLGLKMWSPEYHFDIAVTHEFLTGQIKDAHFGSGASVSFMLQL